MRIETVIKKLTKIMELEGNVKVKLPQLGDDEETYWNAKISFICTEKDKNGDTIATIT